MKRTLFIAAIALALSLVAAAQGEKAVGQWEPFEVAMTANAAFANAYVEAMPDDGKPYVQVTFTGTGGDARGLSYTVAGFWERETKMKKQDGRLPPRRAGRHALS